MAVVGDQLVDDQLHRTDARPSGARTDRVDSVGLVVDVAVGDGPPRIELVEHDLAEQPAVVGLRRPTPRAARESRSAATCSASGRRGDRRIRRMERERVEAALQAHQEPDDPPGHLGDDRDALGAPPRRAAPSTSRHRSGALSGWFRLTLTVRPVRRASSFIHGHSPVGTSTWSGANWNTPCPARRRPSPIPYSSSASAFVPGTSSPDFERWIGVRDVEKPSAPARSPRSTMLGHRLDVGRRRRLVRRATLTHHVGAHRAVGDLRADVDARTGRTSSASR